MPDDDDTTCKRSAVDAAQAGQPVDGQWVSGRFGALVLIAGAWWLGGGGMLAWLVFLLAGPWAGRGAELGTGTRLLVDALLCLLFFFQHSVMVRRGVRLRLTRYVRADFHGALYAAASGTALLVLVLGWQPLVGPGWTPPEWLRWALVGGFLAAAAGLGWGTRCLGEFDALGVKQARGALGGPSSAPAPPVFTVRGPYRWVRHPLYLFSLLIIWSGPVFTPDRLLHNLLWTVWVVIGARLEERDLAACFGDAYRAYQASVPMLLPRSLRPLATEASQPDRTAAGRPP